VPLSPSFSLGFLNLCKVRVQDLRCRFYKVLAYETQKTQIVKGINKSWIIVLFLLLLSACAGRSTNIRVVQEYDFSSKPNFSIRASASSSANNSYDYLYVSAIAEEFERKGFELSSPENADWKVHYYIYSDSEQNNQSLSIGLGTGSHSRRSGISIGGVFQIPLGSPVTRYLNIQLDVLSGNQIIWQANSSVKMDEPINQSLTATELVAKTLKDFPVAN